MQFGRPRSPETPTRDDFPPGMGGNFAVPPPHTMQGDVLPPVGMPPGTMQVIFFVFYWNELVNWLFVLETTSRYASRRLSTGRSTALPCATWSATQFQITPTRIATSSLHAARLRVSGQLANWENSVFIWRGFSDRTVPGLCLIH